jgi:hypothetical protein
VDEVQQARNTIDNMKSDRQKMAEEIERLDSERSVAIDLCEGLTSDWADDRHEARKEFKRLYGTVLSEDRTSAAPFDRCPIHHPGVDHLAECDDDPLPTVKYTFGNSGVRDAFVEFVKLSNASSGTQWEILPEGGA